jgi:DNA-3-methyladenine glycosylase I
MKNRCKWVNINNPLYVSYHDKEWGRPIHDDQKLFEMLILEGAQAGLSWETVLNKRENYQKLFKYFDIKKCARLTDKYLEKVLNDPSIIRNRLKVFSVRTNAQAFIKVQNEFESFDRYIWDFSGGKTIFNHFRNFEDYPTSSELSDTISKDLKKRGFKFIGSTIIYAYLEAIGLYQNHSFNCYLADKKLRRIM